MEISSSYDTLTQLLTLHSGSAAGSGQTAGGTVTTSDGGASSDTDTASWSSLALSLSQSGTDSYLSPILQLRAQNQTLQDHLTAALSKKFDELGIDASQTITLGRDSQGKVTVQGDHPDKDKIEQLFADEPVLAKAFNALADGSLKAKSITSRQAVSLARTNGYSAYLQALGDDSATGDFYLSLMGQASSTYIG